MGRQSCFTGFCGKVHHLEAATAIKSARGCREATREMRDLVSLFYDSRQLFEFTYALCGHVFCWIGIIM
jgi:hypothetical protein